MPVVAQISVDFANQNNITIGANQTNTRAVGPLSLARYCLYNRELPEVNFGLNDSTYLSYDGGFITAGDKVNYKHSDLQIRGNLDLENNIYVDNIHSRRKLKDTANNAYENNRAGDRGITLSPFDTNTDTNNITIFSSSQSKTITLKSQQASTSNSITITSNANDNKININTNNLDISGIVKSENVNTTMWVKDLPEDVKEAIKKRKYDDILLTNNNNAINVKNLISEFIKTKEPFYTNSSTIRLINDFDDQTIFVTSPTNVTIILPTGVRPGTQVSFVRNTGAQVTFVAENTTIKTSPESNFRRLAFENSVATVLLGTGNNYFLFGDLLPALPGT
jgi:hypothetical protein